MPTPLQADTDGTPVLVVTRQIHTPISGIRYFGLIGLGAALAAALVAAALARRFTRPLVAAVDTTGRIAGGDLDARVPVRDHEDPEFARLAESINTMGADLARARDQERQFLMSVSHELRTPLTSIRGYAEAVVDGAVDDPVAAAGIISTEARRLERLVQDLLDLARLDADRFSLDLRAVDAADVVRQVVGELRPPGRRTAGWSSNGRPGRTGPARSSPTPTGWARSWPTWWRTPPSFARTRIVVGVGADGGRAVVWVDDDGPGIPPDQLTRVFTRHVTSDRSAGAAPGGGTGPGHRVRTGRGHGRHGARRVTAGRRGRDPDGGRAAGGPDRVGPGGADGLTGPGGSPATARARHPPLE